MTGHYGDGGASYQVDFDPGPDTFYLNGGNSENIFVLKLNSNGDFIWARGMTSRQGEHSENSASGHSVAVDSDNNVYTTGNFAQITDFDPGDGVFELTALNHADIFIQKLTPDGEFVWAKSFGGDEDFDNKYGKNVYVFNDQVYVIGIFSGTIDFDPGDEIVELSAGNRSDVFILKLDSDANFLWAKNFGGDGKVVVRNSTMDQLGNFYLTGYFNNTVDFDPGSNVFSLSAIEFDEMFIQKVNIEGQFIWVKAIYGSRYESGSDIVLDSQGNIYTVGGFEGTADFDPGSETFNLTSLGSSDIFIHKLNQNGTFAGVSAMGADGFDFASSITIDENDAIYSVGRFEGTVDFDSGVNTFNLTAHNTIVGDPYIQKLNDNFLEVNPIYEFNDENSIAIVPSPVVDTFNIEVLNEDLLIEEFILYDVSGKIVFDGMYAEAAIDISGLKSGMYFVKIFSNVGVVTKKFIKI